MTEGGDRRSQVVWVETYAVTESVTECIAKKGMRKGRSGFDLPLRNPLKFPDNITFRSTAPADP